MNCNNCKHKGGIVPGSSHHISCNIFKELFESDMASEAEWLFLAGKFDILIDKQPAIKRNPHGIQNGWCDFPIQFDPCWIDDCKFYNDESNKEEVIQTTT